MNGFLYLIGFCASLGMICYGLSLLRAEYRADKRSDKYRVFNRANR